MPDAIAYTVPDTARWVAFLRAQESMRPDALFSDPLAQRLAGPRGQALSIAGSSTQGWQVVTRTKLIDDLVLSAVAAGCDVVVNLAAGLDTRPYRLRLPSSLRWVEADLPPLIAEKEELLRSETPLCNLRRDKVDLSDAVARAAFLDDALRGARSALVIAEGLLPYLDESVVRSLSQDLRARLVKSWVFDIVSPAVLAMLKKGVGRVLSQGSLRFADARGVGFFEALGWRATDVHPIFHRAARLGRVPFPLRALAWLPSPDPRKLGKSRWSAVVQLSSNGASS